MAPTGWYECGAPSETPASHVAAAVLAGGGLIDDDHRGEAGIAGRHHATEGADEAVLRIAAAFGLPGGAGLPGDLVAGDRGQVPGGSRHRDHRWRQHHLHQRHRQHDGNAL